MVRYNRRRYAYRRRRFIRRKPRLMRLHRRIPGTRPFGARFFKLKFTDNVTWTGAALNLVYDNNPSNAQDWSNIVNLFDYYKVASIKIHWIPSINTRDLNNTPVTLAHFRPMYVVHDYNNALTSTSVSNDYIQFENLRVKPMFSPWRCYYKMINTINPTGTAPQMGKSFFSTTNPLATQSTKVHIAADSNQINPGNLIGTFIVTYYVIARGRS